MEICALSPHRPFGSSVQLPDTSGPESAGPTGMPCLASFFAIEQYNPPDGRLPRHLKRLALDEQGPDRACQFVCKGHRNNMLVPPRQQLANPKTLAIIVTPGRRESWRQTAEFLARSRIFASSSPIHPFRAVNCSKNNPASERSMGVTRSLSAINSCRQRRSCAIPLAHITPSSATRLRI